MFFDIFEEQERRFDMIEKDKIASIMDTLIEECGECPLERICDTDECTHVWERFLESKVKEDGVEIEEQRSYEADNAQNYNKALEHDADIIRKQINAGWIPVEERLPTRGECEKDNNEFFVQTNTGERFSCEYDPLANGFDNPLWCCNVPVVAWRPLPEPYRPERSMK